MLFFSKNCYHRVMEKNLFDDLPGSHGCNITDLADWETPLLVIRKHWIAHVWLGTLVCILIGICIAIFFLGQFWSISPLFLWLTILWFFMIGIQYVFVQWINIELDILIITNKRVIEYDQVDFLNRKISQASIDQIQEVHASTSGLFGNIFQFGSLTITTAADAWDFHVKNIPRAMETASTIHTLIHGFCHEVKE